MQRIARKSTPKVRGGRVQKKNRWELTADADDKLLARSGIAFEARAPGPGRRHVVTELDVQRFARCIPDWDEHAKGLKAVVLDQSADCFGRYDHRGIIYLDSWGDDLTLEWDGAFFEEHRPTLTRLGVPGDLIERQEHGPDSVYELRRLYFDERSARAFQLVHTFLHELGHHRDRMTPGAAYGRGEEYAESWALRMEELVWPRYREFFGVPSTVRLAR